MCVSVWVQTSIHGRKVSGFEGGEGNSWSAHPMCNSWHCHTRATHALPVHAVHKVSVCYYNVGQALKSNATASYDRNVHKRLYK